jgi:hypothetical protein
MRFAIGILAISACLSGAAAADPTSIEQNGKTNLAVVNIGSSAPSSDLIFKQSGNLNQLSSNQNADQNSIATTQYGWQNTVVIYQRGTTDISSVTQSGPVGEAGRSNLPTSFTAENTDDGYLTYFGSGGFSLVTLGDPGSNVTSRFGRYR